LQNPTAQVLTVKPARLRSEISKLLKCSIGARDVFWVALLSGAADDGWNPSNDNRISEWSELCGTGYSARRIREGLFELSGKGLVTLHKDSERLVARVPDDLLIASGFRFSKDSSDGEPPQLLDAETSLVMETPGAIASIEQDKITGLDGKPTTYRGLTTQLVDLWSKRSGRKKAKALERRVRTVRCRLFDGYSPFDLAQAIAGVCYSPFHVEGGYDTFEVALRNGEQVEKGKRLWLLHAPIDQVVKYEQRTGEKVQSRSQEVRALDRAKSIEDDFAKRLEETRLNAEHTTQVRQEEENLDDAATAAAMQELVGKGA